MNMSIVTVIAMAFFSAAGIWVNSVHAAPQTDLAPLYEDKIRPYFQNSGNHGSFVGKDGIEIRYSVFKSENEKGALVIVPGMGEPRLKYSELIHDWRHLGYSIYILDHRGQGESGRMTADRHKVHVVSYQDWIDDFSTFMEKIVLAEPHLRVFLLGHSMGGAIASAYLIRHPQAVTAAALSAPMFKINTHYIPYKLAKWIAGGAVRFSSGETYAPDQKPYELDQFFSVNKYSHSHFRFQYWKKIFKDDPSLATGGVSYQWIRQAIALDDYVMAHASQIQTPILLLQAELDEIVMGDAQNSFCGLVASCSSRVAGGSGHEILMEIDEIRDPMLYLITEFFGRHLQR